MALMMALVPMIPCAILMFIPQKNVQNKAR